MGYKKLREMFYGATALVLLVLGLSAGSSLAEEKNPDKLIYFFSPSCHRCINTRENVMPRVIEHFTGRVFVEYRDISDAENYRMLFALKQQYKADEKSVFPVLYIGGKFLDGADEDSLAYESIATFVARGIGSREKFSAVASDVDIMKYFDRLEPLAIIAAGLVDGINPCAFTVIVFFMSFLFMQGYTKRGIAVVGMSFIAAVFITYLLLGLGFFGWLLAMKGYAVATRVIAIGIGALSILFGILSLYDAYIFVRKGDSESMVLQLPKKIKARIRLVIGRQYRASKDGVSKKDANLLALAGSALAVGFVISIFESICTGQLYLPTIIFVLKTSPYKLKAFAYLFLYNLMFIIPLIAIFLFALAGVSSQSFASFMKRHMVLVKILLAAMFILLGISLVHADNSIFPAEKTKEELKKDPNFYDFGVVKEGETIKHTFILKNNEDVPVNIKEVNTSCACTSPKFDTKVVQPGKEVPIEISFNTQGYLGMRKRQLFVHTDSKVSPLVIFEIQADVK
jgi:cytochrome c biogenesis protein CcdA